MSPILRNSNKSQTILEILKSTAQEKGQEYKIAFVSSDIQRPIGWQSTQVDQFLSPYHSYIQTRINRYPAEPDALYRADNTLLSGLMNALIIAGDDDTNRFWTIALKAAETKSEEHSRESVGFRAYGVIDGQHRLMSILTIIANCAAVMARRDIPALTPYVVSSEKSTRGQHCHFTAEDLRELCSLDIGGRYIPRFIQQENPDYAQEFSRLLSDEGMRKGTGEKFAAAMAHEASWRTVWREISKKMGLSTLEKSNESNESVREKLENILTFALSIRMGVIEEESTRYINGVSSSNNSSMAKSIEDELIVIAAQAGVNAETSRATRKAFEELNEAIPSEYTSLEKRHDFQRASVAAALACLTGSSARNYSEMKEMRVTSMVKKGVINGKLNAGPMVEEQHTEQATISNTMTQLSRALILEAQVIKKRSGGKFQHKENAIAKIHDYMRLTSGAFDMKDAPLMSNIGILLLVAENYSNSWEATTENVLRWLTAQSRAQQSQANTMQRWTEVRSAAAMQELIDAEGLKATGAWGHLPLIMNARVGAARLHSQEDIWKELHIRHNEHRAFVHSSFFIHGEKYAKGKLECDLIRRAQACFLLLKRPMTSAISDPEYPGRKLSEVQDELLPKGSLKIHARKSEPGEIPEEMEFDHIIPLVTIGKSEANRLNNGQDDATTHPQGSGLSNRALRTMIRDLPVSANNILLSKGVNNSKKLKEKLQAYKDDTQLSGLFYGMLMDESQKAGFDLRLSDGVNWKEEEEKAVIGILRSTLIRFHRYMAREYLVWSDVEGVTQTVANIYEAAAEKKGNFAKIQEKIQEICGKEQQRRNEEITQIQATLDELENEWTGNAQWRVKPAERKLKHRALKEVVKSNGSEFPVQRLLSVRAGRNNTVDIEILALNNWAPQSRAVQKESRELPALRNKIGAENVAHSLQFNVRIDKAVKFLQEIKGQLHEHWSEYELVKHQATKPNEGEKSRSLNLPEPANNRKAPRKSPKSAPFKSVTRLKSPKRLHAAGLVNLTAPGGQIALRHKGGRDPLPETLKLREITQNVLLRLGADSNKTDLKVIKAAILSEVELQLPGVEFGKIAIGRAIKFIQEQTALVAGTHAPTRAHNAAD